MSVISVGAYAPVVPSVEFGEGPRVLVFYKVTCPVCQMAAPKTAVLERAYPGSVVGIGQDAEEDLRAYAAEFAFDPPIVSDLPPYPVSDAYGIEAVPTLVLVEGGTVADVVQSWDRKGYNRVAGRLADLTGREPVVVSEADDGLPPFRPG